MHVALSYDTTVSLLAGQMRAGKNIRLVCPLDRYRDLCVAVRNRLARNPSAHERTFTDSVWEVDTDWNGEMIHVLEPAATWLGGVDAVVILNDAATPWQINAQGGKVLRLDLRDEAGNRGMQEHG